MTTRTSLILVVVLALVGFSLYAMFRPVPAPMQSETQHQQNTAGDLYENEKYGISFRYPDSYQVSERLGEGSAQRERYSIVLMRKADLPPPQGGEGPPSITIDIYQNNLDKQSTEQWVRNTSESNFKLGDGTLASTAVSGKSALTYRWSGLYEGTTIALAESDWVYAFSVTSLEPTDSILRDFENLMKTVSIK